MAVLPALHSCATVYKTMGNAEAEMGMRKILLEVCSVPHNMVALISVVPRVVTCKGSLPCMGMRIHRHGMWVVPSSCIFIQNSETLF